MHGPLGNPDWRALLITVEMKIATPISSLFHNPEQAATIVAGSDCLECRDHSPGSNWPGIELFHTDIQPIHPLSAAEWAHLKKIRDTHPQLQLLSLHMASCCDQPVLVGGRFQKGGNCRGRDELLATAKANIAQIRELFGAGVELAVENNNFYPTPAYRFVCDADFISEVVMGNRLRFLFDMAHAHITATNQGVAYPAYEQQLPLEALIQVHLCKPGLGADGLAFDAHELPGAEEFQEVRRLALSHPLEYLTIEYYKSAPGLMTSLQAAQKIKNEIIGSAV